MGETLLRAAVRGVRAAVVKILLEFGGNVYAVDDCKYTPLIAGAAAGC